MVFQKIIISNIETHCGFFCQIVAMLDLPNNCSSPLANQCYITISASQLTLLDFEQLFAATVMSQVIRICGDGWGRRGGGLAWPDHTDIVYQQFPDWLCIFNQSLVDQVILYINEYTEMVGLRNFGLTFVKQVGIPRQDLNLQPPAPMSIALPTRPVTHHGYFS